MTLRFRTGIPLYPEAPDKGGFRDPPAGSRDIAVRAGRFSRKDNGCERECERDGAISAARARRQLINFTCVLLVRATGARKMEGVRRPTSARRMERVRRRAVGNAAP